MENKSDLSHRGDKFQITFCFDDISGGYFGVDEDGYLVDDLTLKRIHAAVKTFIVNRGNLAIDNFNSNVAGSQNAINIDLRKKL